MLACHQPAGDNTLSHLKPHCLMGHTSSYTAVYMDCFPICPAVICHMSGQNNWQTLEHLYSKNKDSLSIYSDINTVYFRHRVH